MQTFFDSAQGFERARETRCAAARPRAAQYRALQNVRCVPLIATAKPQQRMLEQRQQCHRFKTGNGSLCGKPREDTRRRLGKRIAAGVFDRDIPSHQRGGDAAGERAVRRDQRRGLAVLHRFTKRNGDGERFLLGVGGFDYRHG